MPRASSHESNGGTTSERLERLGREMMPMFRKVCAGCMCESDSTLATFSVRAENIPDYLLRPSVDWAVSPGILDLRTRLPAKPLKLLFRAEPHRRRSRQDLSPRGPVRIAASPGLKSSRHPW